MATCCTKFERRLTRMSLRRTKRPFQGQPNHIGMIRFDYRRNLKLVEQFLCDFDNEPLMKALSKLVNLNNPDLVLFVGKALVGNDVVDQLSKCNIILHSMENSRLKYANNEVYVDLVEEMDAIVNRDGVLVKCEIYGELQVNSHLSGVPD
ncbi:hypothetical protein GBA52_014573 [Prunus armeniaca]|nr:hypothetical protein GBA52_014573 [Prunus armeniaca]